MAHRNTATTNFYEKKKQNKMDTTMANHPESIREHPDRRKKTPNREEVRRESGGGWGRKETHLPDFKNIEKKTNKTIQEMST